LDGLVHNVQQELALAERELNTCPEADEAALQVPGRG
jgi:hypothetical protein